MLDLNGYGKERGPDSSCRNALFGQQSLFPFDPWGGGPDPVVWLNRPVPGIECAVFSPVWVGFGNLENQEAVVHFLAVTHDGWNVLQGTIKHNAIARSSNELHGHFLCSPALKSESDSDCMEAWLDVTRFGVSGSGNCQQAISRLAKARYGLDGFSIDDKLLAPSKRHLAYERYLAEKISEHIKSAISVALQTLHPRAKEALTLRPRLSLKTARELFALAGSDENAMRHVTQALRTESLGLLSLLVEGEPETSIGLVRTLLSGGSLPRALSGIGISKAAHRRSIWSENRTGGHFLFANIRMTANQYLQSQRALAHFPIEKWPVDEDAWHSFIGMVEAIPRSFPEATTRQLMLYCWTPNIDAGLRMRELVESILHLQTAAANFGKQVTLEDATAAICSGHPKVKSYNEQEFQFFVAAKNRLGVLSERLSVVADLRTEPVLLDLLAQLPVTPALTHHGFQFRALRTLTQLVDHGQAANNCLTECEHVMAYIAFGVAVFSVWSVETNAIIGTLALKASAAFLFRGVSFQTYHFEQVNDETEKEPSPVLQKALSEYIATLNSVNNMPWHSFVTACETWRHHAGIDS